VPSSPTPGHGDVLVEEDIEFMVHPHLVPLVPFSREAIPPVLACGLVVLDLQVEDNAGAPEGVGHDADQRHHALANSDLLKKNSPVATERRSAVLVKRQPRRADMDKDRIKGAAHRPKGAVKEAAGKVTGDAKPKAKGAPAKTAGKVHNAYGGAKNAVRDSHSTPAEHRDSTIRDSTTKAHQTASEHHGKIDYATGHEHSTNAHSRSGTARGHSSVRDASSPFDSVELPRLSLDRIPASPEAADRIPASPEAAGIERRSVGAIYDDRRAVLRWRFLCCIG